jgi:Fic family protein
MAGNSSFGAFSWMSPVHAIHKDVQPSPVSPRTITASTNRISTLSNIIATSIRENGAWPRANAFSKASGSSQQIRFEIRTAQDYQQYVGGTDYVFEEASKLMKEIAKNLSSTDALVVEEFLVGSMILAVFSSNYIERAGLSIDQTTKICRRIFAGEKAVAENVDEKDCKEAMKYLIERDGPEKATKRHVIQSRAEIIQHLHAMDHITQAMLMKKMVKDFNKDIAEAEFKEEIDPFFLAAKYSNEFVQIHPFEDGNGRVSRLILNPILLKYAGIVVSIGKYEDARAEYIGIASRAGEEM